MQIACVYHQLNMHIELVLVSCQHVYGMRHQSCDTPASPAFACNMSYLVSSWSCDCRQFRFLQAEDCRGVCIHRCCYIQGLLHFLPHYTVNIVVDQHESTHERLPATPAHPTLPDLLSAPKRLLCHY